MVAVNANFMARLDRDRLPESFKERVLLSIRTATEEDDIIYSKDLTCSRPCTTLFAYPGECLGKDGFDLVVGDILTKAEKPLSSPFVTIKSDPNDQSTTGAPSSAPPGEQSNKRGASGAPPGEPSAKSAKTVDTRPAPSTSG